MNLNTEILDTLVSVARAERAAVIHYHKPGEAVYTVRTVEPYSLKESAAGDLSVTCWQVQPILPTQGWRHFRVDRIERALDSGITFTPRRRVTLHDGVVETYSRSNDPVRHETTSTRYHRTLVQSLMDRVLSEAEERELRKLQENLDIEDIKGIHGAVFAAILEEVSADGRITDSEEDYISETREKLARLCWAP
jgi:predicted DNA-binding transcriptional regulator YafY